MGQRDYIAFAKITQRFSPMAAAAARLQALFRNDCSTFNHWKHLIFQEKTIQKHRFFVFNSARNFSFKLRYKTVNS